MASPRDLVAMKNTIQAVQNLADLLTESHSSILQHISALDRLDDIYNLLERAIMMMHPLISGKAISSRPATMKKLTSCAAIPSRVHSGCWNSKTGKNNEPASST
ncbi:hypothetical protein [Syntrophomonas palmitatica]|uniref:hypothetical protein n=1 Tax=Syntrophomonas palmitatica TaxID=402877 RepID=UPI001FA79211|nr:hypothetical protein [Syntrophomonas palmitatica]